MSMVGPRRRRPGGLSLVGLGTDVRFYLQLAQDHARVLVLGSADGRIALELATQGTQVLGVEPSSRLMASAETFRAEASSDAGQRLRYVSGDLRTLRRVERFDVVFAPQNALGTVGSFEELVALCKTIEAHLLPSGTFAFDVVHATRRLGGARAAHFRERHSSATRTAALHRSRPWAFGPEEIDRALDAAGLRALERFGNFEGKALEPSDALHICVGERVSSQAGAEA